MNRKLTSQMVIHTHDCQALVDLHNCCAVRGRLSGIEVSPDVIEPWLDNAKLPEMNDGHGDCSLQCIYHKQSLSEREHCPVAPPLSLKLWMSKACRWIHYSCSERSTIWTFRCLRDDARIVKGNAWLWVCDHNTGLPIRVYLRLGLLGCSWRQWLCHCSREVEKAQ